MHRHIAKIPPRHVKHITKGMIPSDITVTSSPFVIEGAIASIEVPLPLVELTFTRSVVEVKEDVKLTDVSVVKDPPTGCEFTKEVVKEEPKKLFNRKTKYNNK